MNLLITMLLTIWCSIGAACADSLPVDVEDVRPLHVIPAWRDLAVVFRNLLAVQEVEAEHGSTTVEVLSWALKYRHGSFPPSLLEESIVLVSYVQENTRHWQLGYMYRLSNAGTWRPATYYDPYLRWRQSFESRPTTKEIAAFLRETNYAYNEFGEREILKIVLYVDSAEIMQALTNPIPESEKKRRLKEAESYQWDGAR